MSTTRTGNKTHDDACNAAEGVRQVAVATAANQAAVNTAEIMFYRTVAKSRRDNNNGALQALRSLRVTGL